MQILTSVLSGCGASIVLVLLLVLPSNATPVAAQPPLGAPVGQPQLADGQPAMPGMGGGAATPTVVCTTTPCACGLLGDVGLTTVNGTNAAGLVLPVGENIYGPFEAGFTSTQDNILGQLGCATGKGYVAGGIDTKTAEAVVAKDCGIVLPRNDSNVYISLLDKCGGHTTEYHFHERLSCLYKLEGTHSTKVGEDIQFNKSIYGKWEDYSTNTLPTLDACGGHFGYTPESPTVKVYHYHIQDEAPFTLGCFGPNAQNQEVTMAECRALYAGCNTASGIIDVLTYNGTSKYQTWCPCFFTGPGANNSNVIATSPGDQSSDEIGFGSSSVDSAPPMMPLPPGLSGASGSDVSGSGPQGLGIIGHPSIQPSPATTTTSATNGPSPTVNGVTMNVGVGGRSGSSNSNNNSDFFDALSASAGVSRSAGLVIITLFSAMISLSFWSS